MKRLPYYFRCQRCAVIIESPAYDLPAEVLGCESGTGHEWRRQVDPRRVATHESAHAIAAAVLLGAESVQHIRMERPSESETVYLCRPNSPQALLITMSGPAASARVGDAFDGLGGDLRSFRRQAFAWLSQTVRPEPTGDEARAVALSHSVAIMRTAFESAASDLVDRWEASIDHLALDIQNTRRLEGADLTRAVNEALAAGPAAPFDSLVLDPDFPFNVWRRATA